MNMICRCGPRSSAQRFFAQDASRAPRATKSAASDPTGTLPIQRRFSKDLAARWDALRRTIPNFVTARTDLASTISHAAITGQDPVRAFQKWFDTAVKMVVVGDGRWVNKYVREAGDAAIMRAGTLTQAVQDADFDEDKHPRDKDGKWISGGDVTGVEREKMLKRVLPAIRLEADGKVLTGKRGDSHTDVRDRHSVKGHATGWPFEERGQKSTGSYTRGFYDPRTKKFYTTIDLDAETTDIGYVSKVKEFRDAAPITHDRIPPLQTLCHVELQGIAEATSQQAVRAFANGLLKRETPAQIARDVQQIIDKTAKSRSDLLVSFIVVRAFGAATLDAYRALGVTHVGTIPERIPSAPVQMRDAKPKTKSRGKKSPPKDLVEVLTAGDEKVCQVCEDISEEGPYTLAEAEALIPAHPRCRCAFVPAHDARFAHDAFNPNQPRDKDGKFASVEVAAKQQQLIEVMQRDHAQWATVSGLQSWKPPSDANWRDVQGQNNHIQEPPLPDLKRASYSYVDKVTGETRTHQPPDLRLSSGVIMREPDGRVWLVKPTNNFGGYNYTFPKGGVEDDLLPQANAIKEAYEESGLKARIVGHAGDYRGDTSITRMYHAVREDGHPKDHGWETESVALVHPKEVHKYLNRSRDLKIAKHHLGDEFNPDLHPRDKDGKFATKGTHVGPDAHADKLKEVLNKALVPHVAEPSAMGGQVFTVAAHDVPSIKALAMSNGVPIYNEYPDKQNKSQVKLHIPEMDAPDDDEDYGYGDKIEHDLKRTKSAFDPEPAPSHIDMKDLTKISGKKGSNEGGVYAPHANAVAGVGVQYYIKTPKTKDHVQNELTAAALYKAAGVNTMEYVPVKGGDHVATVLQKLDKDNIAHFNADERHEAQKDFAVHAWLANWDAAGTGGDNQVIVGGKVTTVDTGGSLKYRAQGEPKGALFSDKVDEFNTLRDPSKSPDAAALYGNMTNAQLKESIARVTSIPNSKITDIVEQNMPHATYTQKTELAEKLIARKHDLAAQAEKLTVPAVTPTPLEKHEAEPKIFKTKTEHIKHLLMQGTTSEELKSKMGWKAVSMPQQAAATGLMLEITKKDGKNFYKGIPLSAEDLAAIKQQAAAPAFGKAPVAAPVVVPINMPNETITAKPATTVHPPATEAELTKAKKNLPLQLQYVPGAPDTPAAHALLAEFNKKYEGKTLSTPEELQAKVNAFKDLTAAMAPLQSEQQKAQAAAVAKSNAEAAAKNAALQAAIKAKAEADKAAHEAKMADPRVKAQYDALAAIGLGKYDVENNVKLIAKHGLKITPEQGAFIRAYTGSSYNDLNENLWRGQKMVLNQIIYANALDDALSKMPVYAGDVVRGVKDGDGSKFQRYADNVGHVVTELGFSSAGVKEKLWGSTVMYIKSKRARDIRSFNNSEGGGEVVFRKSTHLHILKVNTKTHEVWAEEI